MAEKVTSFIIENDIAFQKKLDQLREEVSDMRIPFRLIASDFYRSNSSIFSLSGKGLYQDLAPAKGDPDAGGITTTSDYKKQKIRQVGFAYPILVKTGTLARSLLSPNGPGSDFFIGKTVLVMGTTVKWAIYHQSDRPRKKIPQRKVVFIDGGPAERSRGARISGRRERWAGIIEDHIKQVVEGKALPVKG